MWLPNLDPPKKPFTLTVLLPRFATFATPLAQIGELYPRVYSQWPCPSAGSQGSPEVNGNPPLGQQFPSERASLPLHPWPLALTYDSLQISAILAAGVFTTDKRVTPFPLLLHTGNVSPCLRLDAKTLDSAATASKGRKRESPFDRASQSFLSF